MSKNLIVVRGTVKYAQVMERNRDLGDDETQAGRAIAAKEGVYKITVYPDDINAFISECEDKKVAMKSMGYDFIQHDEEGDYVILRRPHKAPVTKDGEELTHLGGPPKIKDADGNTWDDEVNIGNGSVCEVAFQVWGQGNKRLVAIKVLEHVEYHEDAYDPELDWVFN